MIKAPNGWKEIQEFYGWSPDYLADLSKWEAGMIVVPPPEGYRFTYDDQPARGLRVHRKIADELAACLALVRDAGLWPFVSAIGGGYNFRKQRGSSKISMHALGAAVDFDPHRNALGEDPANTALGTEPGAGVVRIFQARGWTWGGDWGRPDSMHVQFGGGF